jgi:toxin ParE1/3/4
LSRITKTARAEQDLEEIWFYLAVDNVGAADALLDEFENSVRLLATQPKMGRAREELASGLRSFPVPEPVPRGTEKTLRVQKSIT